MNSEKDSQYDPYILILKKSLTDDRYSASVDTQGMHIKFKNKNALNLNIQVTASSIGFYFSSGNQFEWFFNKETRRTSEQDAINLLERYIHDGATLRQFYKGKILTKSTLIIGDSQETSVKRIRLFGKSRSEDLVIKLTES